MQLKKIKFLTLRDAAMYFEVSIDILCDWLLDNPVQFEAQSEYDSNNYHPLAEESWRPLLAAADKKLDQVVFKYPTTFKSFRGKGSSRFDDQELSRNDLRIPVPEIERIKDKVCSEISGILFEKHGVNKVRRAKRKWPKVHSVILSAANELLKEEPALYTNKNDKPICSKLAKVIHEQRSRWQLLADESYGTSYRNIEEKLREMKDQLKVPKSRT